jgi:hypothetical protein
MQQLKILFNKKLPNKPYCSNAKGAHNIYPKAIALTHKYIQPNPPYICSWLVFDCDHTNQHAFKDFDLPAPNFICANPTNGHFHMGYAISDVFTSKNARKKPLDFLAAIQKEYTHLLKADKGYSGLITKNPFHDYWETWHVHAEVYELNELADYVDLNVHRPAANHEHFGFGRNSDMFEKMRRWAYRNVHKYDNCVGFMHAMLKQSDAYNDDYNPPLGMNEVNGILKSIEKYVWMRRDYFKQRYERKIGLNAELPLKTKQSLGAAYTSSVKSESTLAKIKAATLMITKAGNKATQKAISEATGLTTRTIRRHTDKRS